MKEYVIEIEAPGPRPQFYSIAEYLWGIDCDVDSDGDCTYPQDCEWTELTLALRGTKDQHFDIDPISYEPLVLAVRSSQRDLCQKVADFIVSKSGGSLRRA